jgi:hypothetical protein
MSKRGRCSYIAAATASVVGVLSLWLPWGALHGWTAIFAAGTAVAGALAILQSTGHDLDRRLGWVAAARALAAVLFAADEIAAPVSMAVPAASVSIVSPAASTSIAPPGWS